MKEVFFGKKVLITGGLGFIGSNLARRLVEFGSEINIVDSLIPEYGGNLRNVEGIRDKISINLTDIREEHCINELIKGQDFLFNLAGQTSHLDSMENPFTDLDINAKSQLSILEACRKNNPSIRIVFASTRQIYGRPQYLPVDEKHPLHPVDVNGINKIAGEQYHMLYQEVYGIESSVLRLTNTYGPRMRVKDAKQTFLGIWIRNLLEGKTIQVFGDGKQRRDYNFVEDVIDAMLIVATNKMAVGKVFNLGSHKPISLEKTAGIMCNIIKNSKYHLVPFPANRKAIDVGDFVSDFSNFEKTFSWAPKVNFSEGIEETMKYFQKEISFYV